METQESLEGLTQEERKAKLAEKNGQLQWKRRAAGFYRTFECGYALSQGVCRFSGKLQVIEVTQTSMLNKIYKKRTPEIAGGVTF